MSVAASLAGTASASKGGSEAGAALNAHTAAAERVYRTPGDVSTLTTRLEAGENALCVSAPQELILFDGARLLRTIESGLRCDGASRHCGNHGFGRPASGERLRDAELRDRWRIRRGGRLVYADETHVGPDDFHGRRSLPSLAARRRLSRR